MGHVLLTHQLPRTFGVNTFAHFWTLKAFLPKMIERKSGHIVCVKLLVAVILLHVFVGHCVIRHGFRRQCSNE